MKGRAAPKPGTFPAEPPKPGVPRDFKVPEPKRFTLDNGLQVALVQWGTMPKVRVTVTMRTGNAFEKADEVWLADLTGDLIREGTATRTAAQISEEAARMGGSLSVSVGGDTTTIGGDVLSEYGHQMVELVADVAMNPKFPESELARLKANMLRNLAVALSQPQQLAAAEISRGHVRRPRLRPCLPDRRDGQGLHARSDTAVLPADLRRRPLAALRGRTVRRIRRRGVDSKAFAPWSKGSAPAPPAPKPSSTRVVHVIDRPGAPQSTVIMGVPTVDPSSPDFIPMTVMDALLGGAFASRITKNIREDKGYTYSPLQRVVGALPRCAGPRTRTSRRR